MSDIVNNVNKFLKDYGMHPDSIDIDNCTENFLMEMERGLAGVNSSLMMIPTYLNNESKVAEKEPVIVMDAGGTNFRVALVTFEGENTKIEHLKIFPMPGTEGAITKDEFLQKIVEYIIPIADKSNKVGFCFSYAAEILPNRDGRLYNFSKEIVVEGSEGMEICSEISKKLNENGIFGKKFVLLNDTVAALLGGIVQVGDRIFESYIGFVLGTGTNTCYCERTEKILKLKNTVEASKMIINIETAGFDKIPFGVFDRRLDMESANPGEHLFEKMISGVYQNQIILYSIKQAALEGLFSQKLCNIAKETRELSMQQIDEFCYFPFGKGKLASACSNDNDIAALYEIIDRSFERTAKLITSNMAAVLIKTNTGLLAYKPVCIVAEGTVFYKSKLLKDKLSYYIKAYIEGKLGRHCEFMKTENANLSGAAAAVLMN